MPENTGIIVGGGICAAGGPILTIRSPIDGRALAAVRSAAADEVQSVIDQASEAFKRWRLVPAPRRGEFVRRIGNELRERKDDLAALVSWESGKITQEALGEVQEM